MITKAAKKHSEYVIRLLISFSRRQWLHERASKLHMLPVLLYTVFGIFYGCVHVFSSLKTKIYVGSLMLDYKVNQHTPSAATDELIGLKLSLQ